ncbi:ABC transporter substrate-binding protein [Streptomonospora nanhaiensis]|uniref:Iron complex transport system substrate-binding protein n=1 Tax=Streptomonospora nanhaiensis TaxID=1323731 RepID=A0A853BJD9_9ACTN|nr:ABC transporter substrate-binding protein [Streptomonospora nanhaiensis]MBV2364619.1 ABC transporter substrate-binding protein [Streptomonospora nanhaiensis]NYI94692.1 iron complex transport system substrate-binding protein [Streptomonospora nanhaiensis]
MKPGRLLRRTAPAAVLALALAACSPPETQPEDDARPLAEPVRVEHQFGTTEIDTVPERIVTIDLQWTDVLQSMGVDPVGYTVDPGMPEGGPPWQDLPASAEALRADDGVPVEQIALLEPDLILGTYSIADQNTYDRLSEIAPTVATLDERQVTPWEELVELAGRILQDAETADEVVDSVHGRVDDAAADLPGLEGGTFALAQYIVGDGMIIVADEEDGSSVFFQRLGMTMYGPVRERGQETGLPRIEVSTERSDLLRADFVAFLVNGGDEDDLSDIPGFDDLPGTVAVLDYATVAGLNTPTPLSVEHALDAMRPHLEEASRSARE